MSGNLHTLWNNAISDLRKHLKTIIYDRRLPSIEAAVFKKERIKVVFFVINLGMWKNDKLFRMFLESDRFDPYIVSFPQRLSGKLRKNCADISGTKAFRTSTATISQGMNILTSPRSLRTSSSTSSPTGSEGKSSVWTDSWDTVSSPTFLTACR